MNYIEQMKLEMECYKEMCGLNPHSLADTPCAPAQPCKKAGSWNKKEEIPMSSFSSATLVTGGDNIEATQRRALADALYHAHRKNVSALKVQYGLEDQDAPSDMTDFIARIKAGQFVLPAKYDDAYPSTHFLRWRDPSVKEDKAGYKVARAAEDAQYEALKLKLAIIPVTDGLAAVEAYAPAAAPATSPAAA